MDSQFFKLCFQLPRHYGYVASFSCSSGDVSATCRGINKAPSLIKHSRYLYRVTHNIKDARSRTSNNYSHAAGNYHSSILQSVLPATTISFSPVEPFVIYHHPNRLSHPCSIYHHLYLIIHVVFLQNPYVQLAF